jgi:hypothetical protein
LIFYHSFYLIFYHFFSIRIMINIQLEVFMNWIKIIISISLWILSILTRQLIMIHRIFYRSYCILWYFVLFIPLIRALGRNLDRSRLKLMSRMFIGGVGRLDMVFIHRWHGSELVSRFLGEIRWFFVHRRFFIRSI